MKKIITLIAFTILTQMSFSQDFMFGGTEVNVSILNDETNIPWNISWGPDHMLWVTDGPRIKKINPKTGESKVIWTSPRRLFGKPSGNGLGFTFHPNFFETGEVYLALDTGIYYSQNTFIEVTKLTYSFKEDTLLNPEVLFTYDTDGEHCGGRLITTQDDKIMVTTPGYWYGLPENSKQGRVLKFNPDGTPAADNPFGNYTYSFGHRNAQGILQTPNGKIYVSEHGQWSNNQDELNLIEAGENYGWPAYDGFECSGMVIDSCSSPTFTHIPPIDGGNNPPAGIDYYNHPAIPEFSNSIIEAVLGGGGGMNVFNLSADGSTVLNKLRYLDPIHAGILFNRLRDVCTGPDGRIYVITNDRGNFSLGPFPERNEANSDAKIRVIKNKTFDHCTPTSSVKYHSICEGETVIIDGVSFSETENTTETLVNAAGCDSLVIHVIEKFPNYNFDLPAKTICKGESVEVFGELKTEAGIYSDVYTSINGCDSIYNIELIVNEVNTNISIEENQIIAEEKFGYFQWLNCPDMDPILFENAPFFDPLANGSYALEILYFNGCKDTSNCEDFVLTSMNSLNKNTLKIWPNPVKDQLNIPSIGYDKTQVQVLNIEGKILYDQQMDLSKNQIISFDDFPKGIYTIQVSIGEEMFTTKVKK